MKNQRLMIEQIDGKLNSIKPLKQIDVPPDGWIHAVRVAIRMSFRQFGKRLSISPQSCKDLEGREVDGTISLNSLRRAGAALGLDLVYGFVPRSGSLEKLVAERALELAREIVRRTAVNMDLEDQSNSASRLRKAVKEKSEEIGRDIPRYLWD